MTEQQCTDGWIPTSSGGRFWPTAPKREDVRLDDIAHALSNICRFGGHTNRFYSVGQHSLLVCKWVKQQDASALTILQALMHDFTEAYIGDMVRPLKNQIPEYQRIETQLETVIHEALGVPLPDAASRALIAEADNVVLMAERRDLFDTPTPKDGWWVGEPEPWPMSTILEIPAHSVRESLRYLFPILKGNTSQ